MRVKLEILFYEDTPDGSDVILHTMSADANGVFPFIATPSVGERTIVDIDDKRFTGVVTRKTVGYSTKDLQDVEWDLLVWVSLTVSLDNAQPIQAPKVTIQ